MALRLVLVLIGAVLIASPASAPADPAAREPNLKTAEQWWPDLSDHWTPVGWKHHRFRYNVFFNGTLLADPGLSQTAKEWAGQGVQLRIVPTFTTGTRELDRIRSTRYRLEDDKSTTQGWTGDATPVLWTEWSAQGLLLRESVFAYTPGAGELKTGTEPLVAWVRLSVHDTLQGMPLPERVTFAVQVNRPHVRGSMKVRDNIVMDHAAAAYPRELRAEAATSDTAKGLYVLEPDDRVRLVVAQGRAVDAGFLGGEADGKDPLVHVTLPAKRGEYVDLLVPMVPTERAVVDRELGLGYDAARANADRYWSDRPATAATIDVPEEPINDALRQFERYVQVLSEKVPTTGKDMPLSGSLSYVKAWATPTGKLVAMYVDPLGYHDLAGEYLEPFIAAQGTRKPPSSFIGEHPGFLGSPAEYRSVDWMGDHGSLLYAISNHALLMADAGGKQRYVDVVLKACEFVRDARRIKGHGGVEGILPPARYSDRRDQTQGVWNDGWNYKGLVTAVRFLRQIDHPRAGEFAREAEDYKATFLAAFRKATAESTTWADASGGVHPFVPTSLFGSVAESARHGFYLDTGPLMLVFGGLMRADDPVMRSAVKWFRDGPVQRFGRVGWNHYQVGFLTHEMSSSIPGYSWNVFHSHQLGDRHHFLEGMYSQYAGAISRQTKTICESRGGITGRITHADTPFFLTRLAAVDDVVAENELHLLRLCPLAWVVKHRATRFENMPTVYGPVSLRWQLSADGKTLELSYEPQFHHAPERVILHVPPIEGLESVRVNGTAHRATEGEIRLGRSGKPAAP